MYPAAVYSVKAAIQFIRAKAADFSLEECIGLLGDSAGAHLAALTALAGDQFNSSYRDDVNATVATTVYDMHAQWMDDLITRPNDNVV